LRLVRPCSSAKRRRLATLSARRSACRVSSSGHTPSRITRPRAISWRCSWPASSRQLTAARATRCRTTRTPTYPPPKPPAHWGCAGSVFGRPGRPQRWLLRPPLQPAREVSEDLLRTKIVVGLVPRAGVDLQLRPRRRRPLAELDRPRHRDDRVGVAVRGQEGDPDP